MVAIPWIDANNLTVQANDIKRQKNAAECLVQEKQSGKTKEDQDFQPTSTNEVQTLQSLDLAAETCTVSRRYKQRSHGSLLPRLSCVTKKWMPVGS